VVGAGNSKSHHEILERPPSELAASPEAKFCTDRILVESHVEEGDCPNALPQATSVANKQFLIPLLGQFLFSESSRIMAIEKDTTLLIRVSIDYVEPLTLSTAKSTNGTLLFATGAHI
jgi:hypothetical protein